MLVQMKYEKELLEGALMGDATVSHQYVLYSNKRRFLEWFSDQMGENGHDVGLNREVEGGNDVYRVGVALPEKVSEWRKRWYPDGEKRIPTDIELTSVMVSMWYATDGGLTYHKDQVNPNASIRCVNESDRMRFVGSLFEEKGFDPWLHSAGRVEFSVSETKRLLDWMEPVPPGYEYKWGDKK